MAAHMIKLTEDNVEEIVESIHFDEPQVDATYGNVSVRMYVLDDNGEKKPIQLETPWMKAPFGVSKFEAAGSKIPKFKLPLSFDKLGEYDRQDVFKKFTELMDAKIVKTAHEEAGPWLKKDGQPLAVVKAFYSPLLTYSKDKKGKINDAYPPKVQLKLGTYNNDDGSYRFAAPVYKDKDTKLEAPPESIVNGTMTKAIVEFSGIWEVGGKFGAGWRCNVIKIKEKAARSAYVFQDDSEDENEDIDDFTIDAGVMDDIPVKPKSKSKSKSKAKDLDEDIVLEEDEKEPVKKKPGRRAGSTRKKKVAP